MKTKRKSTLVYIDLKGILEAIVGLKDIDVLCHSRIGQIAQLWVESIVEDPRCPRCNYSAVVHSRPVVSYVDLPVFGQPYQLMWVKHRLRCPRETCCQKTWTHKDHRISAVGAQLTTRCAKWATQEVGQGRTVTEVAKELHCGWDAVNNAVMTYGKALLEADKKRLKETDALGLDETAYLRLGKYRQTQYVTTVADVSNGQLIDILPTRDYKDVAFWIDSQTQVWKDRIEYGALDMSNTYAAVYSVALPKAIQVVDSFHCIQLANRALDSIRRRVQTETMGHRGRKDDPLYQVRRVLLLGEEKLDENKIQRLNSLLELGDPNGEVAIAYRVKERLRDFYKQPNAIFAKEMLTELVEHCLKKQCRKKFKGLEEHSTNGLKKSATTT